MDEPTLHKLSEFGPSSSGPRSGEVGAGGQELGSSSNDLTSSNPRLWAPPKSAEEK